MKKILSRALVFVFSGAVSSAVAAGGGVPSISGGETLWARPNGGADESAGPPRWSRRRAWEDDLAALARARAESGMALGSSGESRPWGELPARTPEEEARAIVVRHLEGIRRTGAMSDTIGLERYWRELFAANLRPELFNVIGADLHRAVMAGLAPYRNGEELTARRFAETALLTFDSHR